MGQFQSREITKWTKYDPTRLVNGISGWQDRGRPFKIFINILALGWNPSQNKGRAVVLGEFEVTVCLKNHMWNQSKKNWGYRVSETLESYIKDYNEVIYNLHGESQGLAAAIYTKPQM